MKVMIAGGSGLIGSALTRSLVNEGHQVWLLSRKPAKVQPGEGVRALEWDGRSVYPEWLDVFCEMDALVNLAGATIGQWPWSETRKKQIIESRVNAGRTLAQAFEKASPRPPVFLQASGIGYYGPHAAEPVREESPAGSDFLAQVAVNWESATRIVDTMGVRRVILRTGLVLAREGGVLPLMTLPVRFFAGGPMGSGKQGISWIHIRDHVRAIRFLISNEVARGAFNLCAPNPVSNADFMRALANRLGRPYWLPTPAFAMGWLLGEMSDLLLTGQFALPQRLVNAGFEFNFQSVREAFADLY
ncbi:MAG: TIGR01777 family oxidoreductase [Anaerolineales bacterium]|jgi:uncharacterized protein (TIGR01777 family)|nr:TIGR01777 family oxidoreductase [Anaerolineales bacterium]